MGEEVHVTTVESGDRTITTTTTTTTKSKPHATITIDVAYLVPHGVLKVIEIIFTIIVFSLICDTDETFGNPRQSTIVYPPLAFPFAIAIIFFITTFFLLIFFVFSLPDRTCGRNISNYVDAVHNVLAVILFFICFVLLACYCDYTVYYMRNGQTVPKNLIVDELVVAAIFAMACMILYIMSLAFAARHGKIPMLYVKS